MTTADRRRHVERGTLELVPLLVFVILMAAPFAMVLVARGAVPLPMTAEGNAYDRSGSPLPVGTPVRTFIDGVEYSNLSAVQNAAGAYSVLTGGNWVINATTPEPSPTKHGANAGETVLYAASDFATSSDVFQETLSWRSNNLTRINLHLGSAPTTPQPFKMQGIVSQPAKGGPPFVLVCNPTGSPASLADYYLQRDAPGTYFGGNFSLAGALPADSIIRVNLTDAFGLVPTGDALKLLYRNPGGAGASAGGQDIVVNRVEFNATSGGTLDWQPGATILGSAPAPGPGQILERSPSCADTRSPSDFHLATEPGIPSVSSVAVTITAPTTGQNLPGGQVYTLQWTVTDDVFATKYVKVWVNLTVNGNTTHLLGGAAGASSVTWNVPDVSASGATLVVAVADPFGAQANTTATFDVMPATPYSAYIAILIVVVIAVFLLWAYRHARREAEREQRPAAPQPPPAAPVSTPSQPAVPAGPPPSGKKECPQCHTLVGEADETCFYCGHALARPP
ncbi:MAG TPA: hypothetical protein VEY12_10180 [Thermoplasmata archaeon]|nr:hypothetical protein [Thermoplasmata archaeon]